ncbi:MAG: NAD(P)H-hydrate epimerase, partial [Actinomycetes bacterium]
RGREGAGVIEASSVEAVRRAEQVTMSRVPEGALMQRAAAGLAGVVASELVARRGGVYGARVALLVGGGSNGGDALWAGARLAARGAVVSALLTSAHPHREGLAALQAAGGRLVPADDETAAGRAAVGLQGVDVVVDGLLGIGGRPGLTGGAAVLADRLPPDALVVAVDLPSGVDPDTGELAGSAVRADVTVTFGTAKPCLLLPPADRLAGRLVQVDIGLDPAELGQPAVTRLELSDVEARWPVPGATDDKYSRGVLGVVAGGATYTGAAVLCTGAAVRAGAGMVRYVGPQLPTDLVRARWPEVVPGEGRVQAWALGSGVDPSEDEQAAAVRKALTSGLPCVVDAGALEVLTDVLRQHGAPLDAPLLLTPHAGELARLLGALPDDLSDRRRPPAHEGLTQQDPDDVSDPRRRTPHEGLTREQVEASPLHFARAAARATDATVLLKGATTLVVTPDGRVRAQPDGPHWLATAGSGDVLTGVAGVLLAAGVDPLDAGSLAAMTHGVAGARASAGGPVSAESVLDALPDAVTALLHGRTGHSLRDWDGDRNVPGRGRRRPGRRHRERGRTRGARSGRGGHGGGEG